jgi:iron complex outermembrane receptor protein
VKVKLIDDIDLAISRNHKGPIPLVLDLVLGEVIQLFSGETPLLESFGKSAVTFGSFTLLQQLSTGYE